jgi:hypothetical protein
VETTIRALTLASREREERGGAIRFSALVEEFTHPPS